YSTADGTATAGLDYISTYGRLEFPMGVTNRSVTVTVLGDRVAESNQTFFVILDFPANAFRQHFLGVGTVINDYAGELYPLAWSGLAATQVVNIPFPASITAVDSAGQPATNVSGGVSIRAGRDLEEIAVGAGTNLWEYPLGASSDDARLQSIYLPGEIGRAGR